MSTEEETRQRTKYRPARLEIYLKNSKLSNLSPQLLIVGFTITELASAHLFSYSTIEVKII